MISKTMQESLANSSFIRKMFEEGNRLKKIYGEENVFDFSIGNPDLDPPSEVIEAFRQIAQEAKPGLHKYMSNAGFLSTRTAVAEYLNKDAKLKVTPGNVIMTAGAAGAINVALKAILDPGDEVIVVKPFFVEYFAYIKNHGGIPKIAECTPGTFELNIDALYSTITEKTKAIIINSPNNPSGVIYSSESLKALNDMLLQSNKAIYVISDEPYREIVFDDVKVPYTIDYLDNLIMCYSWSKALAIPGDRIGFLLASPSCDDLENLLAACIVANRSLGFVNAPAIMQKVIEKSINAKVDVQNYQRRCNMLYDILIDAGYQCMKPAGSLYLFPRSPLQDDKHFTDIAGKYNLLAVPGSAFGAPGYFRLTFCVSENTIINSAEAFKKAMDECKRINKI